MANGASRLRDRLDDHDSAFRTAQLICDAIDDRHSEIKSDIRELRGEVASLKRTLWIFIGSLFGMTAGLIAVAAALS